MRRKRLGKDEKREVTPEFVNMSKEILYPQIQGVTILFGIPNLNIMLCMNSTALAEVKEAMG